MMISKTKGVTTPKISVIASDTLSLKRSTDHLNVTLDREEYGDGANFLYKVEGVKDQRMHMSMNKQNK
jgi:hypothetical protein